MRTLLVLALLASAEWRKQGSSLVLLSSGTIAGEQPLGAWDEPKGVRVVAHNVKGGVSKDGRFAWTFDAQHAWNYGKTERLEKRNVLRYYGTGGQELWSSQSADAPALSGEPVSISDDGETILMAARDSGSWRVEVRTYLGNELYDVSPLPILESMRLTGNGRYAELRWTKPDEETTYTVLELATKKRHDLPASKLHLGKATLEDDGRVLSGGKVVFSFK